MTGFTGFGPKALAFFEALTFHQSKAWFDENRGLYESDVLVPMVALVDDLTARFARARIPLRGDGRKSVFRINRDVRFAKDKSPYKTHCGAVLTRSGGKKDPGLLYIHIDPTGSFLAAGFYMPEPTALAAFRQALLASPGKAETLLAKLDQAGLPLRPMHQLARMPRGFEGLKDGPLYGMARMKSLVVEQPLPADLLTTPALAGAVADFAARARPLLDWGWAALG